MVNNKIPAWKRILEELIYMDNLNKNTDVHKELSFRELIEKRFKLVTPNAENTSFSRSYTKLIRNLERLSSYKDSNGISFITVNYYLNDFKRKTLSITYKSLNEWVEKIYQIFLKKNKNKTYGISIKEKYPHFSNFNVSPLNFVHFLLLKYDKYSFPKQHQIIDKVGEFLFGITILIESVSKKDKNWKESGREIHSRNEKVFK